MDETYYCSRPFEHIELMTDGKVLPCCPPWLNTHYTYGNIETDSYEELWNGEKAQEFRRSILDGSFRHCNRKSCPHLQEKINTVKKLEDMHHDQIKEDIKKNLTVLPHGPLEIIFNYDSSCNLACPSCRSSIIMNSKERHGEILEFQRILKSEYFRDVETFIVTGSGDAFGSPTFRELMQNLEREDCPSLKTLGLLTNALLAKKYWHTLSDFTLSIIRWINVSVDAACEETYMVNRWPGRWDVLKENLDFIKDKKESSSSSLEHFQISFVVQQNNYKEMMDFARMGIEYGCEKIQFQIIERQFTAMAGGEEAWVKKAVAEPSHPEYQELIKILIDPIWEQLKNEIDIEFGPLYDTREREMIRKIK